MGTGQPTLLPPVGRRPGDPVRGDSAVLPLRSSGLCPGGLGARQAQGPRRHGDPRPGGLHLGRPRGREHHRLRHPAPRPRERHLGDFSVLVANTNTAVLSYTDDTLAASLTYTYRIKAINEHGGVSERSRWFHTHTPAGPDPAG